MSASVNLLLFLSALLSALTGAGTGARPAQVALAVSRAAEATVPDQRAAPSFAVRPAFALPTRAGVTLIDSPAWHLAPVVAPYLSRRRE